MAGRGEGVGVRRGGKVRCFTFPIDRKWELYYNRAIKLCISHYNQQKNTPLLCVIDKVVAVDQKLEAGFDVQKMILCEPA